MLKQWDIVGGKLSDNRTEYAIFDGIGFLCGYDTLEEAEKARQEILEKTGISDDL